MSRTWSEISWATVNQALAEGRAQGLEGAALEKFVRNAYPFGIREHWPYKVWCRVVNKAFGREKERKIRPSKTPDPGQTNFLG